MDDTSEFFEEDTVERLKKARAAVALIEGTRALAAVRAAMPAEKKIAARKPSPVLAQIDSRIKELQDRIAERKAQQQTPPPADTDGGKDDEKSGAGKGKKRTEK